MGAHTVSEKQSLPPKARRFALAGEKKRVKFGASRAGGTRGHFLEVPWEGG